MSRAGAWAEPAKIARAEMRSEMGGLHVLGWVRRRECGCEAYRGMRMDKHEMTFCARSCDAHADASALAMFTFQTMPPSAEEVFACWERVLDAVLTDDCEAVVSELASKPPAAGGGGQT